MSIDSTTAGFLGAVSLIFAAAVAVGYKVKVKREHVGSY